jgi:3-hydroxybutyryl-CoA dehydrogenase
MNVLFEGFRTEKYKVCPLLETMIKEGKLGVKTGQGFYKH